MTKAQKGDLIRVVKHSGVGSYEIGDIFEVEERHGVFTRKEPGVYVKEHTTYIFDYEYEIHRKAGEEDAPIMTAEPSDMVNSPSHYTSGRFETIEIIEEITKGYSDGYVAYCVGNALKYLARAPFKHGEPSEDLSKAAKYLAFANEYLDAKSTQE